MKTILVLLILFSAIALPALGELTDADLNKIRLIVREEVKLTSLSPHPFSVMIRALFAWRALRDRATDNTNTTSLSLKTRISKRSRAIEPMIFWLIIALMALIALPQAFIAWRSRKDQTLERQIEVLTQEIETLKQQRIVNP